MNHRQARALWITAITLAAVSSVNGIKEDDWFYGYLVPVAIIGGLFIFHFRDRARVVAGSSNTTFKICLQVILVLQLIVLHHVRSSDVMIVSTQDEILNTQSNVSDVQSDIEDVKQAIQSDLDDMKQSLGDLQNEISSQR